MARLANVALGKAPLVGDQRSIRTTQRALSPGGRVTARPMSTLPRGTTACRVERRSPDVFNSLHRAADRDMCRSAHTQRSEGLEDPKRKPAPFAAHVPRSL